MMRVLTTALLMLAVAGCEKLPIPANEDSAEPVANEAFVYIPEKRLAELKAEAEKGDVPAIKELANYYGVNCGDWDCRDTFYWELQAARHGQCEYWESLMFHVESEAPPIPTELFKNGETLQSIGETSGCPPYTPKMATKP